MEITNHELAILGLVAEAPKHGYQIERDIQERGMREWAEIGFSSIYHALNKLEARGWLTARLEGGGQGPARKIYALSADGMSGYRNAVLSRLTSPRRYSSDFELALANLNALSRDEILTCLEVHAARLEELIQKLESKRAADRRRGLSPHAEWLFDHSLHALHCELRWVRKFIQHQLKESDS